MALSKQSILKHAGVFKAREVHVPAWADENGDDVVLVRGMTIREFEINQARSEEGLSTASIVVRCVLDSEGGRLFDDDNAGAVAELPMAQLSEISKAIMEESGLIDGPDKAVADAEGKSLETSGSDSSSVSHES